MLREPQWKPWHRPANCVEQPKKGERNSFSSRCTAWGAEEHSSDSSAKALGRKWTVCGWERFWQGRSEVTDQDIRHWSGPRSWFPPSWWPWPVRPPLQDGRWPAQVKGWHVAGVSWRGKRLERKKEARGQGVTPAMSGDGIKNNSPSGSF